MNAAEDRFALTPRELQLAKLFAHGLGAKAIGRCVDLNPRAVEAHLWNVERKINASSDTPVTSLRRAVRKWLSERGMLPDRGETEALVARTIEALESLPGARDSASRYDRERLEKHLAEEKALLTAALDTVRRTSED